jgi:hypothetical protein
MKTYVRNNSSILALALSSRGFGFVVIEGKDMLVDWGIRTAEGNNKNVQSVVKAKKIIGQYRPSALILEDAATKGSLRSSRIRLLAKQLVALAKQENIRAAVLPREKIRHVFFSDQQGSRDELARVIAEKFPDELRDWLPPKRKPWTSEDARISMLEAVALGVAFSDKRNGI